MPQAVHTCTRIETYLDRIFLLYPVALSEQTLWHGVIALEIIFFAEPATTPAGSPPKALIPL